MLIILKRYAIRLHCSDKKKMSNPYYSYENFHWGLNNVGILLLKSYFYQNFHLGNLLILTSFFPHVKMNQIWLIIIYSIYVMFHLKLPLLWFLLEPLLQKAQNYRTNLVTRIDLFSFFLEQIIFESQYVSEFMLIVTVGWCSWENVCCLNGIRTNLGCQQALIAHSQEKDIIY